MNRDGEHIPFVTSGPYPIRAGNSLAPLVDGEPAFRRICEATERAKKSVWVTVAFLEPDVQMPDGRGTVFDVLERARARGIDVRVIFWRCPELEDIRPSTHFMGTDEQRAWLMERDASFLARWDRATKLYCHHQKSWLIDAGTDGEIAFVGGINLDHGSVVPCGHPPRTGSRVDAHYGNVHDVYSELRGPAATDVHHNFVQRWNEASERAADDGRWHEGSVGTDLEFPQEVSRDAGDVVVQIQRTVRRGTYRNGAATPGGEPFSIEDGDYSIADQYVRALDAAKRSIYLEDQAIGSPEVVRGLLKALDRGVEVVFLVPADANTDMVEGRRKDGDNRFWNDLARLGEYERFTLAGIAADVGPGQYQHVYVHAKICLIDDVWCTIGSTNIANRSFYGDTELNASVWHGPTTRALRCELLSEHLGVDTSALDDVAAFEQYRRTTQENLERRRRGERLRGLAFRLDPATYARA